MSDPMSWTGADYEDQVAKGYEFVRCSDDPASQHEAMNRGYDPLPEGLDVRMLAVPGGVVMRRRKQFPVTKQEALPPVEETAAVAGAHEQSPAADSEAEEAPGEPAATEKGSYFRPRR